jgi:hypothetical protein
MNCDKHPETKLICPKCIASKGGKRTAKRHKGEHAAWGKKGREARNTSSRVGAKIQSASDSAS